MNDEDIELVIKMDEQAYRDILLGNIFVNRAIIQNAFENAKPIIKVDEVESGNEKNE